MSKKILIVEDESDILYTLLFALRGEGFTCESAQTGPNALILASTFLPDLVLLDLNIPGLDGVEVCLRLKNDPVTEHAKVIMLTARTQKDDVFLGHEVGADAYLTKPFDIDEIVRKVRAMLDPIRPTKG